MAVRYAIRDVVFHFQFAIMKGVTPERKAKCEAIIDQVKSGDFKEAVADMRSEAERERRKAIEMEQSPDELTRLDGEVLRESANNLRKAADWLDGQIVT